MTRRRKVGIAFGLVATIGVLAFAQMTSIYTTVYEVCRFTASMRGHREWAVGIRTGDWSHPSALETYMLEHDSKAVKHEWERVAATGHNVFGQPTVFSDGGSEIMYLRQDVLRDWVLRHSDEEIRSFHRLLATGSHDEIEKRIFAILDESS